MDASANATLQEFIDLDFLHAPIPQSHSLLADGHIEAAMMDALAAATMNHHDVHVLLQWLCSAAADSAVGCVQRSMAIRLLSAAVMQCEDALDALHAQLVGKVLASAVADVDPIVHKSGMYLLVAVYKARAQMKPELAMVLSTVVTPILSCRGAASAHVLALLSALAQLCEGLPGVVVELHTNLDNNLPCGDIIQAPPAGR